MDETLPAKRPSDVVIYETKDIMPDDARRIGKVKVTDVGSGKVVYKGKFTVGANGRSLVAGLPIPEGQGVLLIEYETGGQKYKNHYLYGDPPFDFGKYKFWMDEAGLIIPESAR